MRICRDGQTTCAEALREMKGIAMAVPPTMKWRRSIVADMIPSQTLVEGTASCRLRHGREARQIGAFAMRPFRMLLDRSGLSHDAKPDDLRQGDCNEAERAA